VDGAAGAVTPPHPSGPSDDGGGAGTLAGGDDGGMTSGAAWPGVGDGAAAVGSPKRSKRSPGTGRDGDAEGGDGATVPDSDNDSGDGDGDEEDGDGEDEGGPLASGRSGVGVMRSALGSLLLASQTDQLLDAYLASVAVGTRTRRRSSVSLANTPGIGVLAGGATAPLDGGGSADPGEGGDGSDDDDLPLGAMADVLSELSPASRQRTLAAKYSGAAALVFQDERRVLEVQPLGLEDAAVVGGGGGPTGAVAASARDGGEDGAPRAYTSLLGMPRVESAVAPRPRRSLLDSVVFDADDSDDDDGGGGGGGAAPSLPSTPAVSGPGQPGTGLLSRSSRRPPPGTGPGTPVMEAAPAPRWPTAAAPDVPPRSSGGAALDLQVPDDAGARVAASIAGGAAAVAVAAAAAAAASGSSDGGGGGGGGGSPGSLDSRTSLFDVTADNGLDGDESVPTLAATPTLLSHTGGDDANPADAFAASGAGGGGGGTGTGGGVSVLASASQLDESMESYTQYGSPFSDMVGSSVAEGEGGPDGSLLAFPHAQLFAAESESLELVRAGDSAASLPGRGGFRGTTTAAAVGSGRALTAEPLLGGGGGGGGGGGSGAEGGASGGAKPAPTPLGTPQTSPRASGSGVGTSSTAMVARDASEEAGLGSGAGAGPGAGAGEAASAPRADTSPRAIDLGSLPLYTTRPGSSGTARAGTSTGAGAGAGDSRRPSGSRMASRYAAAVEARAALGRARGTLAPPSSRGPGSSTAKENNANGANVSSDANVGLALRAAGNGSGGGGKRAGAAATRRGRRSSRLAAALAAAATAGTAGPASFDSTGVAAGADAGHDRPGGGEGVLETGGQRLRHSSSGASTGGAPEGADTAAAAAGGGGAVVAVGLRVRGPRPAEQGQGRAPPPAGRRSVVPADERRAVTARPASPLGRASSGGGVFVLSGGSGGGGGDGSAAAMTGAAGAGAALVPRPTLGSGPGLAGLGLRVHGVAAPTSPVRHQQQHHHHHQQAQGLGAARTKRGGGGAGKRGAPDENTEPAGELSEWDGGVAAQDSVASSGVFTVPDGGSWVIGACCWLAGWLACVRGCDCRRAVWVWELGTCHLVSGGQWLCGNKTLCECGGGAVPHSTSCS
jgi:hypothetical protein